MKHLSIFLLLIASAFSADNAIMLDKTPQAKAIQSDALAIQFSEALARIEAKNEDGTSAPFANPSITEATPVNGVKATRVLTSTGTAPANGTTVQIGSKTYTFQTTLTNVNGNVLIGVSAATALDNLKSAINLTAGAGTTYAAATTAHPEVVATTNTDTAQTVEAILGGAKYNTVPLAESSAALSWASGTLTGGVNCTPAKKGEMRFDATNIYVATAAMDITSTTGWRKIAHSAL
jgi:hypothetical protein